jgi:hypothetical protein
VLDYLTTELVTEPAIVADGDEFTVLLPAKYGTEFAAQLSRLVANIMTCAQHTSRQAHEGAA